MGLIPFVLIHADVLKAKTRDEFLKAVQKDLDQVDTHVSRYCRFFGKAEIVKSIAALREQYRETRGMPTGDGR